MRVMVVAIAVVASIAVRGLAQAPAAAPVVPVVPSVPAVPSAPAVPSVPVVPSIPPSPDLPLGGGKDVSRPLTPVEFPDLPATGDPTEPAQPNPLQRLEDVQDQSYPRRGPLGPGWDDLEFLLWWPKSQTLPPLAVGSRSGGPPILGNPGVAVLLGGHTLDNQDVAGGRFTLGVALNSEETIGVEAVYFFLGSRSLKEMVTSQGDPAAASLGLPFHNAATGQADSFILAAPGVSNGSAFVSSTTRVQGVEGNLVANLYDGISVKVNGLIGYRFLQVNEGIAIADTRTTIGGVATTGPIYDGFDGHNQFNGGQVGLHADMSHNLVFCELTGKVAIGMTSEVVKIDGATTLYPPGSAAQIVPGGIYALPTNMGTYSRGVFAVAPEGICKIGLKLGDVTRLFAGYDFLYLSALSRPADEVDRTLNPIQIPALNAGAAFSGADRPRVAFGHSDFWTQGLIIGLETRY